MTILKWLVAFVLVGYLCGLMRAVFHAALVLIPDPAGGTHRSRGRRLSAGRRTCPDHSDGEKVIVWYVPAKPGHPVVLFFHGNGDFLAGRVARFRGITADGTGLVALSYRGYAGSSGAPSEQGLLKDAEAAYAFTAERYKAERIVVWGFSLGTGVAVAVAADHPVGKLILEAPYTSIADVAGSLFRIVPVRWLLRDQFHSDERIARVNVPLLIMHGEKDPAISIHFGERLFALAHEPKQFVRFPGGGHENLDDYGALTAAHRFIDA